MIFKPKLYNAALENEEPNTYCQAIQSDKWKAAMNEEYDALMKNKTWDLVPQPIDRNIVGCKWTNKLKRNTDGSISKYKTRLVAKGYSQQNGFDFTETFSLVVKPSTIRIVLSIALYRNWNIKQLHVNNAFLKGVLHEDVYMEQPHGFMKEGNEKLVCKLNNAIYGLKQAPRVWFEKLKTALFRLGYSCTKSNNSLFTKFNSGTTTYILIYVDDFIITDSDDMEINNLIQHLNKEFSIKDLGCLRYFLGIEVKRLSKSLIHLSRKKYISEILIRAKMDQSNQSQHS